MSDKPITNERELSEALGHQGRSLEATGVAVTMRNKGYFQFEELDSAGQEWVEPSMRQGEALGARISLGTPKPGSKEHVYDTFEEPYPIERTVVQEFAARHPEYFGREAIADIERQDADHLVQSARRVRTTGPGSDSAIVDSDDESPEEDDAQDDDRDQDSRHAHADSEHDDERPAARSQEERFADIGMSVVDGRGRNIDERDDEGDLASRDRLLDKERQRDKRERELTAHAQNAVGAGAGAAVHVAHSVVGIGSHEGTQLASGLVAGAAAGEKIKQHLNGTLDAFRSTLTSAGDQDATRTGLAVNTISDDARTHAPTSNATTAAAKPDKGSTMNATNGPGNDEPKVPFVAVQGTRATDENLREAIGDGAKVESATNYRGRAMKVSSDVMQQMTLAHASDQAERWNSAIESNHFEQWQHIHIRKAREGLPDYNRAGSKTIASAFAADWEDIARVKDLGKDESYVKVTNRDGSSQQGFIKIDPNGGTERDGLWISADKTGKVSQIAEFKDGKLNGEVRNFAENGQRMDMTPFINDKRHGAAYVYGEHGKAVEKVTYANGAELSREELTSGVHIAAAAKRQDLYRGIEIGR